MKMFYEKYYLAYEFFQAKTVTIEANIHGCLTKLYFPKLPLCDRITEDIKKQFLA